MADDKPLTENDEHRWAGGRVSCPSCQRTRYTDHLANLCVCGRWFEVNPGAGGPSGPRTAIIDGPAEVLDA